MTSVWGRGHLPQKNWASKAPTGPLSHKSNHEDQDHKNPLGSNNPFSKPPKAPSARISEALEVDAIRYTKKDLQQINQLVVRV